jgi:hypothetical protein
MRLVWKKKRLKNSSSRSYFSVQSFIVI